VGNGFLGFLSSFNWQQLGNLFGGATFLGIVVALINKGLASGDNKLAFKRKDRDDVATLLREQAAGCEAEKKLLEDNLTECTAERELERRRVTALSSAMKNFLAHLHLMQSLSPATIISSTEFVHYLKTIEPPEKVLEGIK